MMIQDIPYWFILSLFVLLFFIFRILSRTSLLHIIVRCFQSCADSFHVYQSYRIPQFNEENLQENQLYHKVSIYLNNLASLEDSDFTNLYSGAKANDIFLRLDTNQTVNDTFLGARVSWRHEKDANNNYERCFVLKMRKKDRRRILRAYLQHIFAIVEEFKQRNKEIKLYMNSGMKMDGFERWVSVPFTHPATFDTISVDAELKNKVKADLELFLKSKQYYHKIGRVWKRSYLLYGPSGTGKSSFMAAMAKFLSYDIYNINMSELLNDSYLKVLLMQISSKSLIVIEDFDKFPGEKSTSLSSSGLLNFMDGIISCCREEQVIVYTVNDKDLVDQAILGQGRIDVHIHFPMCDYATFKAMANNHLGVKDHKLFQQIEEVFQGGNSISHAEVSEIMTANRNSPSRALKLLITALNNGCTTDEKKRRLSVDSESGIPLGKENVHMKEFRKLYGFLRMGSRRKEELVDFGSVDKEGSKHNL